jgi:hypothetical protein
VSAEAPTPPAEKAPDRHILKGALFRRQGRRVTLTDAPPQSSPPPKPEPVRRPAKVARMLALAHHLQRTIDEGLFADRAAVARKLGLTRARVTQLLDLLLLAPRIQEAVLMLEAVDGVEPICERKLRGVVGARDWSGQMLDWRRATGGIVNQGVVCLGSSRSGCRRATLTATLMLVPA